MHEWGDSGITAILLAIAVAVLVTFGVAQQARSRAARYHEIRRLQSVAAEEARREEAEADAEYTSMVAARNCCAVCLNLTTTRCSRCKAVRYCSAACQGLHWKQGHKQECRAPEAPSPGSSSNGSRNFSDVLSSVSSGSGSRTLSEVSDAQIAEDGPPAGVPKVTQSVTANGSLLRPKEILFPYDYFIKLFNWERLQVPPCGLINCGNSCFANVVLQCLTHTRPLAAFLLEGSHGEECRRNDWCFMCELQDHVWRVRQNQSPFSPIRILSRIRNIGNHLGYGRQEDAHEFMRFAIDSMQSICLDEAGGEKSVEARTQETTFIHHIFGGHLQSQVKCMQCLQESNRYENMMDLAVEIHGCVETLEDALTQFTTPELLDGENKYKCDRCNAYVKARKRLTLHEAPNILTIALKRFQSGKFGKLNKRVTFPEVLDIAPYMSGKGDSPPVYRLYAVVVHVDMLNASFFGHYICYVKDSQGLWYKIDDSKVKEVDLEKVMSQRAYMLFYARSYARPPPLTGGSIQSQTVLSVPELGRLASEAREARVLPLSVAIDETAAAGAMGLHAMVDYDRECFDIGGNLQGIPDHSFASSEIARQSMLWEAGRVTSSTSNADETSVGDSGCVTSGSCFAMASPFISSYRSDHMPHFESKICQLPDPSTVEGTEYVSWDHNSSLPCDFSEVSLQACPGDPVDKSCLAKVGKRRLEDGLSPLPTPKPLDTDQLPAWPTGNHARSSSSPSLHVPGNLTSCSVLNESYSSWQICDFENVGESSSPISFEVEDRTSGDQISVPGRGEPIQELDRNEYKLMEATNMGEQELVARAKRQHVEVDSQTRAERPRDKLQGVEHSNISELGRGDMDWDESVPQVESPDVNPVVTPVIDLCVELNDLGANCRKCPLVNEVTQSVYPVTSDVLPPNSSSGKEVSGVLEKPSCEGLSVLKTFGTDGLPLSDLGSVAPGSPSISNGKSLADVIGMIESSIPLHPLSRGLPGERLEVSSCSTGDVTEGVAPPPVDCASVNGGEVANGFVEGSSENTDCILPNPVTTKQEGASVSLSNCVVLDLPGKPVLGKLQKVRAPAKPLFTPGFLNRVRNPISDSKGKLAKSIKSCSPLSVKEHGHVMEGQVRNFVLSANEVTEQCSPNGEVSNRAGSGILPTAATRCAVEPKCGNCANCELFESHQPYVNGHENVHKTANGLGPVVPALFVTDLDGIGSGDGSPVKLEVTRQSIVNGSGSPPCIPDVYVDDEHSMEPVRETLAALGHSSVGRQANGKQKQGRNETCNCGSQRKWKKCCGRQSGVIKPEPGRRRLVV